MIRINLLPQRKTKRADRGQQTLAAGVGAVLVAAAAVFFLVHQPLQGKIEEETAKNAQIKQKVRKLRDETKDFEKLQAAFKAAEKQRDTIAMLQDARATPAWFLRELSTLLTKDKQPTMTPAMAKRVREDPNRSWAQGWDPKHVWIDSFSESKGVFKIVGGAQSDTDVTQLALRMQASMFFQDVIPMGGNEVGGGRGGQSYYRFTVTGKAVY